MDLNDYIHVLWRFKIIVVAGFVLAVVLAVVSFANTSPTYQSTTQLLVTQQGFPWGRSVIPIAPTPGETTTPQSNQGSGSSSSLQFADPSRFTSLAALYAQLLNSDVVQSRLLRKLPQGSLLTAEASTDPATNTPLPIVNVIGLAHSPKEASRITQIGTSLFKSYIARQQSGAHIQSNQRVLLEPVSTQVKIESGRKKTIPIVAFFTVMLMTVGLAFILENLRPRVHEAPQAVRAGSSIEIAERRPA
jgi:capsular polysaccharide biosynthesis protein